MPGRSVTPIDAYAYGMNGQMRERETFEGAYSADYWGYDSRLGRRWEMDPMAYDWQSPYCTFDNNPIVLSDELGLFGDPPVGTATQTLPKIKILTPAELKALAERTAQQTLVNGGSSNIARNAVVSSPSGAGILARSLSFIVSALLTPFEAHAPGNYQTQFVSFKPVERHGTHAFNLSSFELNEVKRRVESGQGTLNDHKIYNDNFAPPAQAPFKTQSHHVIPVNVFTKINNPLVEIAMKDPAFAKEINNSDWNLIPLGSDVHGNHPAYEAYIRNQLDKLYEQVGDVSSQKAQELLRKFSGQMKGDIINKLRANPSKRLNEIYGGGKSKPSQKSSSSKPSF